MNTQQTQESNPASEQSVLNVRLDITSDEIRAICELTAQLTEMRQKGCQHLCIENFAPKLFHGLLTRLAMQKNGMMCMGIDD
jgi:hypothetical protein